MPSRPHGHAGSASTSSLGLPPRFTVPPLPPRIHRKLVVHLHPDGLLIVPLTDIQDGQEPEESEVEGFKIGWGVKGRIEGWQGRIETDEDAVELGGILGLVRLWDAAYALVILPPAKPPFPLFRDHVNRQASPDSDERRREAGPSSHEVHNLRDVHPIPLTRELAENALERLRSFQAKRHARLAPPKKTNAKWGLAFSGLNIKPSAAPVPENQSLIDSDDEEHDIDDDRASYVDRSSFTSDRSRESSAAPEADETPIKLPSASGSSSSRARNRLTMGWGRFAPRLGTPKGWGKGKNWEESNGLLDEDVDPAAAVAQESGSSDPMNPDNGGNAEDEEPVRPFLEQEDLPRDPTTSNPLTMDAPQRRELEKKIIKQIIREFTSGGFFYSFDFDLTHTLQHKRRRLAARQASFSALQNLLPEEANHDSSKTTFPTTSSPNPSSLAASEIQSIEDDFVEPDVQVPLWRRVDRRFFWNEWLVKDFLDAGLHSFILPVSQGWIQGSSFDVPIPPDPRDPTRSPAPVPIDLVVVSRRSKDRAGLRYQRRGIDDEGHVANMVETEMIVRAKVEDKVSLFSFVQIRGSIPLRWSQSPYSMKPPPVLDQPVDQTYSVANLHFDDLVARYGPVTIINLSEQTGKEAVVTNGYKELIHSLGRKDLSYRDFDFHAKCHGMRWENIGELVDQLDFADMSYLWTLQGEAIREQNGVFRTNCIDCLDRTNVVQSALGRHVLTTMLTQLGLVPDPATCNVESIFNDVWANNGDMLSLCYAHTSALKGDFVRTGKRDVQGMLHDGISSISRMFYGAVSDFFDQAVISFFLGHRNLGVFSEFLENLESSDASALIKLSRVRAAAIETSSARVLEDGEQRIAGWTLLSPSDRNVKISPKLEEKVLLLTHKAIYVVSFNYSLEKVTGFTRLPLTSITSLQKGSYILSTLQEAGRDPAENAGFLLNFSPLHEDTRYSTYSMHNRADSLSSPATSLAFLTKSNMSAPLETPANHLESEFFAFKVLPREFVTGPTVNVDEDETEEVMAGETCRMVADKIVKRIRDQCQRVGVAVGDDFIIEKDVVSLAEAQKSTSLLQRMDYAVKRFLWL